MQSRLSPFICAPELQTEAQSKNVRVLGLPEYYPEYRDTGDGYAAFLGSSITAKVQSTIHLMVLALTWRRLYSTTTRQETTFPSQSILAKVLEPLLSMQLLCCNLYIYGIDVYCCDVERCMIVFHRGGTCEHKYTQNCIALTTGMNIICSCYVSSIYAALPSAKVRRSESPWSETVMTLRRWLIFPCS